MEDYNPLDMLKTEKGQLDAVFACYGSAMQAAQYLEVSVKDFLDTYNGILGKKIDDGRPPKFQTLGAALRTLNQNVTIEDEAISDLLKSANARNFLAHHFFVARSADFKTKESRMGMLRDLTDLDSAFKIATRLVGAMRSALRDAKLDPADHQIGFDFSQVKPPGPFFPRAWTKWATEEEEE